MNKPIRFACGTASVQDDGLFVIYDNYEDLLERHKELFQAFSELMCVARSAYNVINRNLSEWDLLDASAWEVIDALRLTVVDLEEFNVPPE